MGSKAKYGALMGLGQGISGYGKTLTVEELRQQEDKRVSTRQHSLQQIRQQYQNQRETTQRNYMDTVRTNDRSYQERRELERLNPESEVGAAIVADEERKSQLRQDEWSARPGYGGRALSALNQSQWTPESFGPFLDEYNALIEAGHSPKDADRMARANNQLVPAKPKSSGAASDASANAAAIEDTQAIMDEYGRMGEEGVTSFLAFLVSNGYGTMDELKDMTLMQLAEFYKAKQFELYRAGKLTPKDPMEGVMGLMQPGGAPGGQPGTNNPDPLGLRN